MNTKNTKTAVIILLVIANLFFIWNIFNLKIKSENIPSEMIDDAVNILGNHGFVLDKSKIPAKKPLNPIYEGVYSQNIFADIVRNFSGASDEELRESGNIYGPTGIYFTAGDYRFIFSDSVDDYFKIKIIEKSYAEFLKDFSVLKPDTKKTELEEETERQIELLAKNGLTGVSDGAVNKAEKIIRNFIRKYQNQDVRLGFEIIGFGSGFGFEFEEDKSNQKNHKNHVENIANIGNIENIERVLINQTVDKLPIDSHIAYIEIQDGKVKYFSGEWYFGEFVAKRSNPLLDSVNILFKCMEIDGAIIQDSDRLDKMDLEYTVMHHATENDTEKFYFIPSWRILFDSGKKLSYNMITGDKN